MYWSMSQTIPRTKPLELVSPKNLKICHRLTYDGQSYLFKIRSVFCLHQTLVDPRIVDSESGDL